VGGLAHTAQRLVKPGNALLDACRCPSPLKLREKFLLGVVRPCWREVCAQVVGVITLDNVWHGFTRSGFVRLDIVAGKPREQRGVKQSVLTRKTTWSKGAVIDGSPGQVSARACLKVAWNVHVHSVVL